MVRVPGRIKRRISFLSSWMECSVHFLVGAFFLTEGVLDFWFSIDGVDGATVGETEAEGSFSEQETPKTSIVCKRKDIELLNISARRIQIRRTFEWSKCASPHQIR